MDAPITLRAMRESDLAAADHLFRLAFGTWFQLPDPMQFRGDAGLFVGRMHAYPDGGVVAESGGAMVGLTFASRWGSLGVLGPVAVHPDYWRRGVARILLPATLENFARWQCRLVGLFTFPASPVHLRLYQDFGFWPRHLTPVMAKPVSPDAKSDDAISLAESRDRAGLIASCGELANSVFAGLDLGREIAAVLERKLGDVIAFAAGSRVEGFAICHTGAGSEGGSQGCYIKFALARSAETLSRLLDASEAFAHRSGAAQISTGTPTGRHGAYRMLAERGFRQTLAGVQMHRPYIEGFDRPDVFALDDWR
ncbi:MAG TPA: GNAT family N-acetyltransferase [Stellaceae bacterium]|nr:GNAT family N-acetyltransferase [Stellaceae bacterium]